MRRSLAPILARRRHRTVSLLEGAAGLGLLVLAGTAVLGVDAVDVARATGLDSHHGLLPLLALGMLGHAFYEHRRTGLQLAT